MISLSNPFWLSALLAIPFIWWLHHFSQSSSATPVSALFLWQNAKVEEDSGKNKTRPTALWFFHALIFSLLVIALTKPQWSSSDSKTIHVWFDDSLSMSTQEQNGTRYKLAVNSLINALSKEGNIKANIHFLTQPGKTILLQSSQKDKWQNLLKQRVEEPSLIKTPSHRQTINLPVPVLMAPSTEHWLVSDGVNRELSTWLENAPVTRIIQVGKSTENRAITRLSLRPSLILPNHYKGLLSISNLGIETNKINVELLQDNNIYQEYTLKPASDETKSLDFILPQLPIDSLSARITTPDALYNDNQLTLNISNLKPVSTKILGNCGKHIRAAISTHPLLKTQTTDMSAQLTISCTDTIKNIESPLLWFHPSRSYEMITSIPQWLDTTDNFEKNNLEDHLILKKDWIGLIKNSKEFDKHSNPVLIANNSTLISQRNTSPKTIDVFIDMENPNLVKQAAYPLLFNRLIDLTLNASSKMQPNRIITKSRNPDKSNIKARTLMLHDNNVTHSKSATFLDLSPYLILLAGILILLDWFILPLKRRNLLSSKAIS